MKSILEMAVKTVKASERCIVAQNKGGVVQPGGVTGDLSPKGGLVTIPDCRLDPEVLNRIAHNIISYRFESGVFCEAINKVISESGVSAERVSENLRMVTSLDKLEEGEK